ncbi:universal stress protein [Paenibacillus sp. LHD-117]|uniref:universal stress protein n=1 Tax=Paenibacillus sp. LHD-117 TaxID=3071412 RepID=UPI0027E011D2|nr:universal stress protein [Paenibacillus sp. LHD-117]MDQ6421716.1 universal stress protein [Paenibacillus sp. LHD-117]
METFRRKSPEEILLSISKLHRGKLTIIIGAVSGSGKTYHMLLEGQSLKQQGVDVVICAVSTMGRPETVEQLGSLERVPSIHWHKGTTEKKDLNLDALIARNPEVVLVDGLAHRNRPDATYSTRLEDIRFLLSRGISVITTVNVYELEGVTRMAYRLTGIEAEETVPAETLETADEVRLIDVTPETMLKRIGEGNLCGVKDTAVLKKGNLGVLRELALRLMAEDVNDSLEKHREEQGLIGPSGATERILVSAQYHWNGSIYIRRGQQVAKRLNGDLHVVSFVKRGIALSKEESTFKRSIEKLTDKIGAAFTELPYPGRRHIPKSLVRYAMDNGVTRIVLGHSKHSRWKELWQGSIVNGILRRIRNVDVFFVADRADHEGERILPAKSQSRVDRTQPYRRLSEQEVERQIDRIRRGTFKVYLGAAPGVGKTYTMLREGNALMRKGIQVAIGLLETHGRQDTIGQINGLPLIPQAVIDYRGTKLKEMDVPAILERNPEVVLIDELAHTNVPGSKNKKRYEDVLDVLEAGISVISTMNVQHLESLNDAVEQITGVRVRETVPDRILQLADEVELIDVTPERLRQRMREGRIYAAEKIDQALGNFFKTGNLIALRELALREIADDVDERLEAWERKESLRGPWRRRESIFVAVTLSSNADRLVRRGFRIAHRLKAEWHVMYVHPSPSILEKDQKRIDAIRELTERLGGRFEVTLAKTGRDVPRMLLGHAFSFKSTQMIIGQSARGWWQSLLRKSIVRSILSRGRHMDVLVVADFDPELKHAEP